MRKMTWRAIHARRYLGHRELARERIAVALLLRDERGGRVVPVAHGDGIVRWRGAFTLGGGGRGRGCRREEGEEEDPRREGKAHRAYPGRGGGGGSRGEARHSPARCGGVCLGIEQRFGRHRVRVVWV